MSELTSQLLGLVLGVAIIAGTQALYYEVWCPYKRRRRIAREWAAFEKRRKP